MLKVMLVDDDAPMLRYLHKLIPWKEMGLAIAATARSGAKALEQFEETLPHLVVTDIGMPKMDGLELAARLRGLRPDVRIIFLTCHEDFAYARSAVQLGADDYLIKDELTADALRASVDKASRLIRLAQESAVQSSYREEVTRNREVLKRSYWHRIVSGDLSDASLDAGRRLGIEWREPDFMLGLVHIDRASIMRQYGLKDAPLIRYGVYNIAQELAQTFAAGRITVIADERRDLICIMNYRRNLAVNAQEAFRGFAAELRRKSEDYMRIGVGFVAGCEFKGLAELGGRFAELQRFDQALYYAAGDVHGMTAAGMAKPAAAPLAPGAGSAVPKRTDMREALIRACRDRDESDVMRLFDEFALACAADGTPPGTVVSQFSQWVRLLEYETGYEEDSATFHADLALTARLSETLHCAGERARTILLAGMQTDSSAAGAKVKLSLIDRYIAEHLSENISLVSAANYLYMNPSYFSRYFKKLAGVNFTDYVNRCKMDVAKQLMKNRDMTVEMISDKLGYSDRTYFSKVFKKYNGASPAEYKGSMGKS